MQNVLDLENCMKEFISRTCISFTGKLTVLTEELREEFLWLHGGPTNSVFQQKCHPLKGAL